MDADVFITIAFVLWAVLLAVGGVLAAVRSNRGATRAPQAR
jgi:hypothetical protein